jgi:Cu+-exporting ATPase
VAGQKCKFRDISGRGKTRKREIKGAEREMAKQMDPVCGMQVDEQTAAATSEHEGQTYYFCSAGCKTRFDQNPEQYTKKTQ